MMTIPLIVRKDELNMNKEVKFLYRLATFFFGIANTTWLLFIINRAYNWCLAPVMKWEKLTWKQTNMLFLVTMIVFLNSSRKVEIMAYQGNSDDLIKDQFNNALNILVFGYPLLLLTVYLTSLFVK